MRLVRSWPQHIPDGRAYVVDDMEHLVIDNHDYGKALVDLGDDVLLLEWDMAVGQEELRAFADLAQRTPDQVLVAPYRIYADAYGLPHDIWAHRTWDGDGMGTVIPRGATPIRDGVPYCNLFGLGLVYLPRDLIAGFVKDAWATHFGDTQFSMWHYQNVTPDVPVDWAVRPVHLNFRQFLDEETNDDES
jgi:hypothetical protein